MNMFNSFEAMDYHAGYSNTFICSGYACNVHLPLTTPTCHHAGGCSLNEMAAIDVGSLGGVFINNIDRASEYYWDGVGSQTDIYS